MIREPISDSTEADFIARLSREIRTPMNGITGMINLLLDTGLDAEQRSYANMVARAADSLLDRLDHMITPPGGTSDSMAQEMAPVDLQGLRLLVVDENKAAAQIGEQQLQARKIDVDRVTSCPEAFEMLISAAQNLFPFDMVLVDHAGTAAMEFSRRVRQNPDIGDIPLLMISSTAPGDTASDEIEASGFDGFLSRPVGTAEMVHMISAVWSARRNGQELSFMTRQKLRQRSRKRSFDKTDINYAGLEVLLAEDNSVNRMVAGKILEKDGFVVTMAKTGRAALDLVRKKRFDIILMDCQMPEMDGYQATAEILDYERAEGLKHVPIIAFTANVMAGDDEKCLAAGMDDYISKPVQPENMIDIMSRWLTGALAGKARKAELAGDRNRDILIEPDIFETLSSLVGDRFIAVLESYISTAEKIIPAMQQAIRSQDAVTLRRESHSLKSSSMQIGALSLGGMASEMEKMSLRADFDETGILFPALSKLSAQVVFYLENYIALNQS